MKENDVLFCRKDVINAHSNTVAYHLLHPRSILAHEESAFLSSLFVDVNLTEITQQKTIFFQTRLEELENLPFQKNIEMVIFLDANSLSEETDVQILSDKRLQGYQLGIINSCPDLFSADFLAIFSYALFNLDDVPINCIIDYCSHPLLTHKNLWINKVETAKEFALLKKTIPSGYFSGNFIKRVTTIKGKKVLAYKTILFDLLTELNQHETSPRALASCIERDPTLTYRIIKLTHTGIYHRQFNVSNAQRAVEIIGIRDLIKWVGLLMLSSVSGKPDSLVSMAVSRAFFCQNIASVLFPKSDGAFLVGLFSYLPSFLYEELPTLLKELPLDENIKSALLEYKGNLGGVLKIVEAYESGRWEKIPFEQLADKDISKQALKELYIESLKSAREMNAI